MGGVELDDCVLRGVFVGYHAADVGTAYSGNLRARTTATRSGETDQFAGVVVADSRQRAGRAVDDNARPTIERNRAVSHGEPAHGATIVAKVTAIVATTCCLGRIVSARGLEPD